MQQTSQNAFLFYLHMFLSLLIALAVRVIAFAPLAALVVDSLPAWAALLCPVLVIFVVLPLRFSFADAMACRKGERHFAFGRAFSFRDYGEKLSQSLLHALHVLKWGIPLALMGVLAYYWYSNVDALTLLKTVTEMGRVASQAVCAVANVFGAGLVPAANTLMDGVMVVLGIVGVGIGVWAYGAVRNSATRYIWAAAVREDRVPATEVRRRLMGRRWEQLGVGLINLLLFLPFVVMTALQLKETVSGLSTQLMMAIASGSLPSVDLTSEALPILGWFCLLYLPILPIRRWLTAAFALRERKQKAAAEKSA